METRIIYFLTSIVILVTVFAAMSKEGSFIDRVFEKFRGAIVIYVVIGIYITYYILKVNIEETKRSNTLKIIDHSWLNIVKIIQENYSKCPKFCSSLFFDWQKSKLTERQTQIDGIDDWSSVMLISVEIFQSWENVLTVADVDQTGLHVWLCNFAQWAKSPKLYKIWKVLYPNYANRTITFGNILFSEVQKNPPKNEKELEKFGNTLFNDIRIKQLFTQ